MLPLEVGMRVMCQWRDNKYQPIEVIKRHKVPNTIPDDYGYYVHYTECKTPHPSNFRSLPQFEWISEQLGFWFQGLVGCIVIFLLFIFAINKRLDEWAKLDQFDLNLVEAVLDEKVEEKIMIIFSPNCTTTLFESMLKEVQLT